MAEEALPFGIFRAVPSDELLAFVERAFVEPAPEAQRDRVRAEALAELTAAELELAPGDLVISRSGGQEFVRVSLPAGTVTAASFNFEKVPGVWVRVERRGPDVLVAFQGGKPAIEFRRLRSS